MTGPAVLTDSGRPAGDRNDEWTAPAAYLRFTSARLGLGSRSIRLQVVLRILLSAAGARVLLVDDIAVNTQLRDAALSWVEQQDPFSRLLRARTEEVGVRVPTPSASPGAGVLLSDDVAAVARQAPTDQPVPVIRVLWAAAARDLLTPPTTAYAALTLTHAEAAALRAVGCDAVSLQSWPQPAGWLPPEGRPARVVLAVGADQVRAVDAIGEAVRVAIAAHDGGADAVLRVLPDVALTTPDREYAPVHPWVRARWVAAADVVLAIGDSPAADLVAAEAAAAGTPALRVLRADVTGPHGLDIGLPLPELSGQLLAEHGPLARALAERLPDGYRLTALDDRMEGTGHAPLTELADWVGRTANR